jgi:hypothetical protein
MSVYLLIESRDPFEAAGTGDFASLAMSLARAGHRVTFFLVENGVLVARQGSRCDLDRLGGAGIDVFADEFALAERGIPPERRRAGVRPASLDLVVEHMANGHRTLWR